MMTNTHFIINQFIFLQKIFDHFSWIYDKNVIKTSNFNNRQKYKYQLFKLIKQQKYSFIFHSLLPFLYKK